MIMYVNLVFYKCTHGSWGDDSNTCIFNQDVTTAKTDNQAFFLLKELGMPFKN